MNLKSIVLPSALTVISRDCFKKSGIESIIIPSNVRVVEARAFMLCRNLKSIKLSESLEVIEEDAFG